jgi:hypothetical protein
MSNAGSGKSDLRMQPDNATPIASAVPALAAHLINAEALPYDPNAKASNVNFFP